MKPYNRAIINFMWWKSRRINKLAGKPMGYMLRADEEAIARWEEEKAKRIWCAIINSGTGDASYCAFCVAGGCYECEYRETHGKCNNRPNTYTTIKDVLSDQITLAIGPEQIESYLTSANSRLHLKLSNP